MGRPGNENRPAKLPGNAPEALRQFVACTTDRVQLDLSEMGWVPKPKALPDSATPEVTIAEGWTPTSATIQVGWGYIKIGLAATIVDGQLHIDSTGLGFGIGDEIDPWIDAFNETLRANDKQLDSFDVDDGKVTMTKRAIPAGAAESAAVAAGGSAVSDPTEQDESEEPPKEKVGLSGVDHWGRTRRCRGDRPIRSHAGRRQRLVVNGKYRTGHHPVVFNFHNIINDLNHNRRGRPDSIRRGN